MFEKIKAFFINLKNSIKADITGVSVIYGKGIKHVGTFKKGLFFDNCELQDLPAEQKSGWGIKFDLFFAYLVRPIPKFWKMGFWKNNVLIKDVPYEQWEDTFGKKVTDGLKKKVYAEKKFDKPNEIYDAKYSIYNPWKGIHWFVFRWPKFLFPCVFISIGTPWKNFYVGFKTSKVNPIINGDKYGDITWTNSDDIYRALDNPPDYEYRSAVLSGSMRTDRE